MDRLTLADWQIINNALAEMQAGEIDDTLDDPDLKAEAIKTARKKVHQRLKGRTEGPWDRSPEWRAADARIKGRLDDD